MTDVAIRVENLSKRYLLGHQANAPKGEATLRDNLVGVARGLIRRTKDMASGGALVAGDSIEEFWALKDVSFEVKRGEVVGIIGRNGAGKSTLLKILSRITEPSSGRITLKGRVSSLLEVGTGFHPELSGRENIFLNGAILGMSRKEIQAKFDEIVDFAEVERFLDTPVKRYSSGMYVRLAFAVAAHLEPEILIVDEVLAVGDSGFQAKCLGKMGEVAGQGRTVLFVSHNVEAIRTLCTTGVMLSSGNVSFIGSAQAATEYYLSSVRGHAENGRGDWADEREKIGIKRVVVSQPEGYPGEIICGKPFRISISLNIDKSCTRHEVGFGFRDDQGRDILCVNNKHLDQNIIWPEDGWVEIDITIPEFNWIGTSKVYLSVYFGYIGDKYEVLEDVVVLTLKKSFKISQPQKLKSSENLIFIDNIVFALR